MAVVLSKRCNAAARRHSSALRVGLSAPMDCVAPLAKDYGHYLRDAPCHERGQTNWIRNYHVDGALAYQYLGAAHVGLQAIGNADAAICLLVIFQYSHQGPAYRQA